MKTKKQELNEKFQILFGKNVDSSKIDRIMCETADWILLDVEKYAGVSPYAVEKLRTKWIERP